MGGEGRPGEGKEGREGGERAGNGRSPAWSRMPRRKSASLNTFEVTDGPREAAQNSMLWMLELGYAREKLELTHEWRLEKWRVCNIFSSLHPERAVIKLIPAESETNQIEHNLSG